MVSMKKKKLLKQIESLKRRVTELEQQSEQCKHCENFKAKTVKFVRYKTLPMMDILKDIGIKEKTGD